MSLRVYVWNGQHVDAAHAGGWALGTFAVACADRTALRRACAAAGVPGPSRPTQARATDDVVQIALAHPDQLLFVDVEARGAADPHWRVVSPPPAAPR